MNGKRSKITMTVLILVLIFQACYIVLVTMVPDPGSRMYLLRNLTPAPYMKMEPASFELLAMLASQRYGAESALVKYMRERFGDNPELAEYLEWLEGHLEEGKRGTMDDLAELKSFLDQGGKLYEYSYEKGTDSECGLIVIKGGKELYRQPFIQRAAP